MKEIKGTFNFHFSHFHTGSHRTSDGFKYRYRDTYSVDGPYFDTNLPLTYQDFLLLNQFTTKVKSEHFSQEEDYEWAESYTANESVDQSKDFGLCKFFNDNFSSKYHISLSEGTIEECSILVDDMPSLKTYTEAFDKASEFQKLEKGKIQQEITRIKLKLSELEQNLQVIDSPETFDNRLLSLLYYPLKENPHFFDLNKPIFKNYYALDVALFNKDETLLNNLILNGAFSYGSDFQPNLSAKCGDFSKVLEIIKNQKITSKSIENIYKLIALLPITEVRSLFEDKSDLVRNGRLLISYKDKLGMLVSIRGYYHTRGYQSPFDREPYKTAMEYLLQSGDLYKANYIYNASLNKHYNFGFREDDMLELSFEYGNIEFINTFDLWTLVGKITDIVKYSHAFNRYEYDRWGDELIINWKYEPYVKPEIIGQELYNKIIDQIQNHKSSYIL